MKKNVFSEEIINFSKIVDKLFKKVSLDVKLLKKQIDEKDQKIVSLEKSLKSTVLKLKEQITSLNNKLVTNENISKNTILGLKNRLNTLQESTKSIG